MDILNTQEIAGDRDILTKMIPVAFDLSKKSTIAPSQSKRKPRPARKRKERKIDDNSQPSAKKFKSKHPTDQSSFH